MKTLLLSLILVSSMVNGQNHSCCKISPSAEFGQLALKEDFAKAHEAPLPVISPLLEGEMVQFICPDSSFANAFEIRATSFTTNWLIVIHEWWGLNDHIKLEAEKIQTALDKVNILAIDLYDGRIAETPENAQQLLSSLSDERARNIIQGAIRYAGVNARIYSYGWCMGGTWAMQTALEAGSKSHGCVFFYGMPETNPERLKNLSGDVLGIFATKDEWINQDVMQKFDSDMKLAKKNLSLKVFNADHAFANPSNPKYDHKAASEANKAAIDFLKKRLK